VAARQPTIAEVRGKGLMVGIELADRGGATTAAQRAVQVRAACRERGLIIGIGGFFGNVLRIQPPLVITEEQLGSAVATLDEALTATA
jgi:4-aminobutyrate aminotransferase / (S)-3-amino-2-methylpropionate transaminase / 5-aminovalerate transaminase